MTANMTIIIESKNPYNHRWSFKMELQQEPLIIERLRATQFMLFSNISPSSASPEEDISDETKMILGSSSNGFLLDKEREKVLYNDCFENNEEIIENLHILDSRLKTHFGTVYLLIKSGHENDQFLIDCKLKDILIDYGLRKILPFPMMAERTSCCLAINFIKTNQDRIANVFDGIVIDKDCTYNLPKVVGMATYKDLLNIIEYIRKNLDKAFASRLEKVVSPISKNDKSWNTSLGQLISSIIKNDAIVDNPPGNSYETEYETLKAFEKLAWIVGKDGRIIFS